MEEWRLLKDSEPEDGERVYLALSYDLRKPLVGYYKKEEKGFVDTNLTPLKVYAWKRI